MILNDISMFDKDVQSLVNSMDNLTGGILMAEKSKQKKEVKKAPQKSLKEKRKAKEEKKNK
jgi:hypothetical protein